MFSQSALLFVSWALGLGGLALLRRSPAWQRGANWGLVALGAYLVVGFAAAGFVLGRGGVISGGASAGSLAILAGAAAPLATALAMLAGPSRIVRALAGISLTLVGIGVLGITLEQAVSPSKELFPWIGFLGPAAFLGFLAALVLSAWPAWRPAPPEVSSETSSSVQP